MVISSVEYFLADKGVVVLFLVTYGRRRIIREQKVPLVMRLLLMKQIFQI